MKVSVCMNTARGDYPMTAFPEKHIFEFLMESLRNQTFKDFEVVICDVIHDTRADYFEKHPESFPVKHVPIKSNVWTPRGYTAICASKNTCLMYAQGEIVVFTDDCSQLPPTYLEEILGKMKPNLGISNRYECYLGDKLISNDNRKEGFIHNVWGNIALPLEIFLKVNGYNEMFDGSRGLEDCEFSNRVHMSGVRWYLLNTPAVFQAHTVDRSVYPTLRKLGPRCCRLPEQLSFTMRRQYTEANKVPYSEDEFSFLKQCDHIGEGEHHCPFTNNRCFWAHQASPEEQKDFSLYRHPSLTFDLRKQREDVSKTIEELKQICSQ